MRITFLQSPCLQDRSKIQWSYWKSVHLANACCKCTIGGCSQMHENHATHLFHWPPPIFQKFFCKGVPAILSFTSQMQPDNRALFQAKHLFPCLDLANSTLGGAPYFTWVDIGPGRARTKKKKKIVCTLSVCDCAFHSRVNTGCNYSYIYL